MSKKCNFCDVIIKDETDHCPLCGGVLDGDTPGIDTYPNVLKKEKAISFIFRLTLFIAIIASCFLMIPFMFELAYDEEYTIDKLKAKFNFN